MEQQGFCRFHSQVPPPVCAATVSVTMSDFADIPAVGDAFMYDEEQEEEIEEGDEDEPQKRGKYCFNGRYIYVTWSKSKINSKEEFEQKLSHTKMVHTMSPGP